MKRCSLGGRVGPAASSLAPAGHTHLWNLFRSTLAHGIAASLWRIGLPVQLPGADRFGGCAWSRVDGIHWPGG